MIMFSKALVASLLLVISVSANEYGGYGGGGGEYGNSLGGGGGGYGHGAGPLVPGKPFLAGSKTSCFGCDHKPILASGPYGGGAESGYGPSGYGYGGGGHGGGSSLGALPVLRTNKLEYMSVPQAGHGPPPAPVPVMVDSHQAPIQLVYRSFGAPVNIIQKHIPSPGTYKQSHSEEEPHRHLHTVTKPVIQEVREIISPYRLVKQEILPVQEEIQTIVAKAAGHSGGGGGGGNGGGTVAALGGLGGGPAYAGMAPSFGPSVASGGGVAGGSGSYGGASQGAVSGGSHGY